MVWLSAIIILILAYIIVGLILPSTVTIANSLNMCGNSKDIYKRIEDFNNWGEWAIWNDDQSMVVSISLPSKGKGAKYSWKSKVKEIKCGSLVLIDNDEDYALTYEFNYNKKKRGQFLFNIEEQETGTFVTCAITIDNKRNIFSRYFLYLIKNSILKNIEEVLLKIDGGLEISASRPS